MYVGKLEFSLGHIKFEVPIRHSSRAGWRNLKIRGKFRTGEINPGVITVGMAFKD